MKNHDHQIQAVSKASPPTVYPPPCCDKASRSTATRKSPRSCSRCTRKHVAPCLRVGKYLIPRRAVQASDISGMHLTYGYCSFTITTRVPVERIDKSAARACYGARVSCVHSNHSACTTHKARLRQGPRLRSLADSTTYAITQSARQSVRGQRPSRLTLICT